MIMTTKNIPYKLNSSHLSDNEREQRGRHNHCVHSVGGNYYWLFMTLMDTNRHSISVPFTDAVQESLPPARYKETVSTLLSWLQQCEAKLAAPSAAVTELPIMDQRLKDVQVCF